MQATAFTASGAGLRPVWSAGAARDRLSSTAFLAALLHGIVILGVTFGAEHIPAKPDSTSSLEVVLVTSDDAQRPAPERAVLLAQQNLVGSGNAPADAAVLTSPGYAVAVDVIGPVQDGASAEVRAGEDPAAANNSPLLLASRSPLRVPDQGERDQQPQVRQSVLPGSANAIDIVGRIDAANIVPDENPRELLVSANTREARIATYLSGWKRKVEQVGTLNFPLEARQAGVSGYPTLEVAIKADGSLKEVLIRNSSGQHGLDEAAVKILRLSAPFEPLPDYLRTEYDVVRFAYEWHFSDGTATVRASTAAAF